MEEWEFRRKVCGQALPDGPRTESRPRLQSQGHRLDFRMLAGASPKFPALAYFSEGRVKVTYIIDTVMVTVLTEVMAFWYKEMPLAAARHGDTAHAVARLDPGGGRQVLAAQPPRRTVRLGTCHIFGVAPSAITANEANYLIGFKTADEIRNRLDGPSVPKTDPQIPCSQHRVSIDKHPFLYPKRLPKWYQSDIR